MTKTTWKLRQATGGFTAMETDLADDLRSAAKALSSMRPHSGATMDSYTFVCEFSDDFEVEADRKRYNPSGYIADWRGFAEQDTLFRHNDTPTVHGLHLHLTMIDAPSKER